MNKLSNFLVEQMLLEDKSPIKKVVVIYGGRFQPFHKGHYGTYSHLVKKFGKDNVFISTSNKVEKPKSPFNFKEKVKIISTMFNIPKSKIVQVKNNYAPTEILKKYDKNTTAFITVVGEKDAGRLGGKYFQPWKGKAEVGYEDGGYVYTAPSSGGGISGTETRNGLSVGSDEQKKSFFKSRAYGKFNATIFNMITDKLNEGVIEISKERIEEWLINESSKMSSGQVDDGPNFFFPNYDVFSRINIKRAQKIGYEVVNMITSKEIEDYYDHPIYPNGPVKAVSFFPAGVLGTQTAANQIDIYSSGAYSQWFKHSTRKAAMVGYELVKSLASKEDLKQDKEQSVEDAKGDKVSQKEYEASLNEAINLPVEVGDTILMGRFKNKKVVVKSIGKDEHGMPTINGKKVVTFRLMKEGFEVLFEDDSDKYTHVGYGIYKKKGKEDDEDAETFKKDGDSFRPIKKDDEEQSKDPKAVVKGKEMFKHSPDIENKPEQDNWEKVDDKTNYYKSVRKYTDKELENETGEYFENEKTEKTAPNAFKDKADMIEKIKNAKPVYLSSEEMENMNNTDMGEILKSDNPKQTAKDLADGYGKDISWQYKSIENNEKVPAPIALKDKNGEYYLVGGNTRAMAFTAAGRKLPIKIIDYDGEFQWQENESISESNWPKSKLSTQHNKDFDHHLNYRLSKKFKGNFEVIGFDLYHDGKKLFTIDKRDTYNSVIRKTLRSLKESINELAGTAVRCEKCNHSWDIEEDDNEKYLCHSCGWDSQQQEYDYAAFDSWQEKMGLNEELDERSKGKLRPADKLRRKAALAGKRAQIARRRKRTMMRRKSLSKLKKIAYKKAYLEVYKEFMEDLFPGISKSDLSIQQAKIVHKNVLRKKKRVLKRARFKFLPKLRDAEAQKFSQNEMSKSTLNKIEKYAEKQLSPEDIEFTKHFFDRINDPRNGKEISDAELTGFFKRLSKYKKQFRDFLEKYKQIVVTDKRNSINIPFVKQANQIIAKTVMRKDDFKTSNPKLAFEVGVGTGQSGIRMGYPSKDDLKRIEKRVQKQRSNTDSNQEYQYEPITEQSDRKTQCINNFVEYACKRLKLKETPKITLMTGTDYADTHKSLGGFNPTTKEIFCATEGRLTADICRTIAHELVHRKQDELGLLKNIEKDGADGSPIENQANAVAGIIMREYGRIDDTIYQEGKELQKLGITDFKSLFKKMPGDLQKRVYNLKNFGQRVDKHPEGNVLKHTITVVNRSLKEDDIDIAIAAMFHDIGKDETAGIHPKKGHITHWGHEKVSAGLVKKYKKWIESVGGNTANVFYIVRNHMKYKQLSDMRPKKADKVKSFRAFDKLSKFSKHDRSGLDESKQLKLRIPNDVKKIHQAFKKNGKKLYVVGGAVRDAILGKSPKDFDVATDAKPDEVEKIAKDNGIPTKLVGKRFGVVIWIINGVEYEVATFRKDIGKGRRPDRVDYTDIHGDVKRRDLTVNALFYDIDRKEIVDLVGGIEDLKKKKIRTVGKAEERFDEDPLRKLRALRFWTRLGGTLDKELLDALQKNPSLKGVSSEAIRDEFLKAIKSSKNTKDFLEMCDKVGFTSQILPNLKVSKPYIKTNDYILFLAWILRKNSPTVLNKILNKINYSNIEKDEIVYLNTLQNFTPEKVLVYKKGQSKADDNRIITFGKMIGKDFKKLIKFKPSVKGGDVPSDVKGPAIGQWIANKEKENYLKEGIITEGGAYGHMNHPFDTEINLTFGQLKDIVNRALEGTLEYTREKTDGQALAISWRDGRLVAARNKGHLKNKGENALDIKGVSDKFQGRGGLSDAYNYAMKDLTNAIKSLSDKQRDKIFKQGACFMNLEVIYPTSVNVIPYGQALLVFHGTMEYNDEGVAIGENGEAARILAGMIKQVNKDVQDNYTIQGPPVVKLPKSTDLSKKRSKYSSQISKLQKEFGLKDTDGVANYHQAWWEQWVDKNSPSSLDNKTKMGLVKRWAFMDKKFRLDKSNISDEKTLDWAKKIDKEDQKKISKQNLMKFEQIFLGLGAEVLEFTSSALTVNPDAAVRDMKKRIDKTIKDVKKSGDPKKIEKLKLELGRLNSIGGAKKIVPNEGIVFLYKGNTFKLTGTFASVNQILGIFF